MYKSCFSQRVDGKYLIHLWSDEGGYEKIEWEYPAYREDSNGEYTGLNGEKLSKTTRWDKYDQGLHFHDIRPYQRFLIDKYGDDDTPSKTHREVFFDIEIEMGGALTEDYIKKAPKPVTSIAWWDKQIDEWSIVILDKKGDLQEKQEGNRKIYPVRTEQDLLEYFLRQIQDIAPDILVGYNSDYFDIPYLYFRMKRILGEKRANQLSPIGIVRDESQWNVDGWLHIAGVQTLDYMKLHKKFSFKDEPSYKLNSLGEKYVGLGKVEYDGSLDRLFKEDIDKFIEYNFRDVEILQKLDEKFQYLGLTKNLAHKGKINYRDVYKNSWVHDGAISTYLLSNNQVPPSKDPNPITKKNYAGAYLFCPNAGLYRYMFDEDLTSLYPSIIMSVNIGKETYVGRIFPDEEIVQEKVVVEGKEIFNCRLGLNDLEQMDPNTLLTVENKNRTQTKLPVKTLIETIKTKNLQISANGVMFRTDRESVLSKVLSKWFDERVEYKNKMKQAYKSGDTDQGEFWHLRQYTMKILLNSLYGALALASFRFGSVILSEAITLSGQRIIQESSLFVNRHMNKVLKQEIKL
jgi:DNA polymerase elongation subunit (family B)